MKFSTSLLTLLAASSVYSINIFKRDLVSELDAVSPECKNELLSSKEFPCISFNINDNENREALCEFFKSETCKKYYENTQNFFPSCKNEEALKFLYGKTSMEFYRLRYNLVCSTDGEGNYCPAGDNVYNNLPITEITVADTCLSKKCTMALNDLLSVVTDKIDQLQSEGVASGGSLDVFDYLREILNEESCSSMAADDLDKESEESKGKNELKGKISSDATTITKMSSSLLLTLGLILTYF